MVRLEANSSVQTIRLNPSSPISFVAEPNIPYSVVLVNEESKEVRVAGTFNSFASYKGQLELSLNYGFTATDEDQVFMAYIMSKPLDSSITALNYLQYFGYVVYSYKILVTSVTSNNPIFWSINGGNQLY